MKISNFTFASLLGIFFVFSACSAVDETSNKKEIIPENKNINKTEVLYNFLEKSGNVINTSKVPTLISATAVEAGLSNFHVIDLRKKGSYIEGHIDGAVNVKPADLIGYMKKDIAASAYDKVILVCNTDHVAAYSAGLLQLLGYSNVYAMKWGMCSWDKEFAKKHWGKAVSDKYSSKMVTEASPANAKGKSPEITATKNTGYEILEERAQKLLEEKNFKVSADAVFANLDKYYIVNYWKKEHYDIAHIPGAVQYEPKKSLTRETLLSTLPTNKPIAVYCYTGQNAAFTTAYLNVLGYKAYTIKYGANAMMHNKLISEKIGHAFDINTDPKNFPMVKGEKPSLKVAGKAKKISVKKDNAVAIPVIKKKEKEEEGGC